ncbi:hypothetical protein AYI69_g3532 [Smittium culicis]|uniref:Uncharacterized protein n=1 Tax=Smittium culicis TaxID=133412 RepID=A0A1R1YJF0_9FUNG|nr:hypothetical protein AYI69_g3532 [Smittium culicis]
MVLWPLRQTRNFSLLCTVVPDLQLSMFLFEQFYRTVPFRFVLQFHFFYMIVFEHPKPRSSIVAHTISRTVSFLRFYSDWFLLLVKLAIAAALLPVPFVPPARCLEACGL